MHSRETLNFIKVMNFFLPEKYIVHYIKKRRYLRVYPKYVFVKVLQNFTETGFLRKSILNFDWSYKILIFYDWLNSLVIILIGHLSFIAGILVFHWLSTLNTIWKLEWNQEKAERTQGNFIFTALKEPETERIYTLNHP